MNNKKVKIKKDFFGRWNPNMAYVLGFIFADGCLLEHKNGYNGIDITSKDKDLLLIIKKKMEADHKIGKKTRSWHLQVRNTVIYRDLSLLGLTPRKSKSMLFPRIPKKYMADFIRGYFDGDGGITIWPEPRWKHTWQIRTTFSSGSRKFLEKLHKILLSFGMVNKGRIAPVKRGLELCLSISDSLKLYSKMYKNQKGIYLKRKKRKFEIFIKLRKNAATKGSRVG